MLVAGRQSFSELRAKARTRSDAWDPSIKLACPCSNQSWCAPLTKAPVSKTEVFGFVASNKMNWTYVTTIAWSTFEDIGCDAHQHNVRLVLGAPAVVLTDNATARQAWIKAALAQVQASWMDGITFDWENPTPQGSNESKWYAQLISETRTAFHQANPAYQISTCVAWSPDDIDGRGYDMPALSDASDLLYVMDYDTRSVIFDHCIASANAPVPGMLNGLQRYEDIGIPFSKLVLGVPWYGYQYECLPGTAPSSLWCPIRSVPFRGFNCSDAAGSEIAYSQILNLSRSAGAGEVGWDDNMKAPFFNFVSGDGSVKQYWFDNPRSLTLKSQVAKAKGLLGLGPFTFSYVDDALPADAKAMWSSFDPLFS
jgi:di-N-acetylchitobiase